MDNRPKCKQCGRRIGKDYGDGICATCRVAQQRKNDMIRCPKCGARMHSVARDGSKKDLCYTCEQQQDLKSLRAQLTAERSKRLSGREVRKNLDDYFQWDARRRANVQPHVSYGMYMAMRAAEIKEGKK